MSSLPPLNRPLNDRAESSFTLSSEYYLSQQLYEAEKQKIFYRTWQNVAHQSMLADPGDYITLTVCDENIFVIRSSDNQLRAAERLLQGQLHRQCAGLTKKLTEILALVETSIDFSQEDIEFADCPQITSSLLHPGLASPPHTQR